MLQPSVYDSTLKTVQHLGAIYPLQLLLYSEVHNDKAEKKTSNSSYLVYLGMRNNVSNNSVLTVPNLM